MQKCKRNSMFDRIVRQMYEGRWNGDGASRDGL